MIHKVHPPVMLRVSDIKRIDAAGGLHSFPIFGMGNLHYLFLKMH